MLNPRSTNGGRTTESARMRIGTRWERIFLVQSMKNEVQKVTMQKEAIDEGKRRRVEVVVDLGDEFSPLFYFPPTHADRKPLTPSLSRKVIIVLPNYALP